MTPAEAAALLAAARAGRRTVDPFTDAEPGLDAAWAYDAQDADRAARLAAGARFVGAKLGLTSTAKQDRMGVREPIVGFLTSDLALPGDGSPVPVGAWAQPRAEPEVAFRLGSAVGAGAAVPGSADEVDAVVDAAAVALEVIDSRFTGYRFRLPDVVADATSAAGFVVGPWVLVAELPGGVAALAADEVVLSVDGAEVDRAPGAAVLGDPRLAVVHLARHLAARGEVLPSGSVVLAGAVLDAVPLGAGATVTARSALLGEVRLRTSAGETATDR